MSPLDLPSASRRAFLTGSLAVALTACTSSDSAGQRAEGDSSGGEGLELDRTPVAALARSQHATALLPGGLVLLIGGLSPSGMLTSCQVIDVEAGEVYDAAPLAVARGLLTATPRSDGTVLCLGGSTGSAAVSLGAVFDPAKDSWTGVAPLADARFQHAALAIDDDRVIVTGGTGVAGSALTTYELYEVR